MNAMGGHRQPRSKPQRGQDATGEYETACVEFADEFGWQRREIWDCWRWCALMIECEQRVDRELAEWCAMRLTEAMFDQRGREPS